MRDLEPSAADPHAPSAAPSEAAKVMHALGPTNALAVAALVLPPLGGVLLLVYLDSVGSWLRGHEGAGLVLYIGGFALASGLSLLPTYTAAILGGWAFGFAAGFPAALAGFLLGALLAYALCRWIGGDRAERVIEQRPVWRAVREALVGSEGWRTLGIVALIRVPFNSPFAITNLVLASVRTPLVSYVLGTLVGMAPRTGLMVYLAVRLRDALAHNAVEAYATLPLVGLFPSGPAPYLLAQARGVLAAGPRTPWWYWALGIVLTIVVIVLVGAIAKRAIARVVGARAATAVPAA